MMSFLAMCRPRPRLSFRLDNGFHLQMSNTLVGLQRSAASLLQHLELTLLVVDGPHLLPAVHPDAPSSVHDLWPIRARRIRWPISVTFWSPRMVRTTTPSFCDGISAM